MRDNMPKYDYFVAHEFTRQEKDDLREAIDQAFRNTQLNACYSDEEFRSGEHILKKIEDSIHATQFGIYDITTVNPNVYLELGLAKGAGRPFYIICKKGTEIRADLQGLGRIEYESYKNLTDEIKKKILPEVFKHNNNKPDNGELEIFAIYKKVRYNAKYYPKTKKVIFKEKPPKTPSGAGTAVTKHPCDGWLFWRFIDKNGKEQKLNKLRN
jgi:hypothetical protein